MYDWCEFFKKSGMNVVPSLLTFHHFKTPPDKKLILECRKNLDDLNPALVEIANAETIKMIKDGFSEEIIPTGLIPSV